MSLVDRSSRTPTRDRALPIVGIIGVGVLTLNVFVALFGALLAPNTASAIVGGAFAPPGDVAWLGNDYVGRDLLSRLLYGARYTLGVAAIATAIGFSAGTLVGFAAAEIRGRFDLVVTWLVDVLLSFPPILLALLVISGVGSSVLVLIGVMAFVQWPRVARVARSVATGISAMEFVEVARARGEALHSILWREILPNALRPLSVEFGLRVSFAILFMSSLSFLGLGIQPPEADWGSLVRENMSGLLYGAPAAIIPALLVGQLVIAINLTVDWLSDGYARTSEELR